MPENTTESLQSKDTRNLLDIIDRLRSHGISKYVDLPQIIVCGEQSSGKSSVLEAISGMSFPSKDNLCTRFATELILRRNALTQTNISIVPGSDTGHTSEEKEKLLQFKYSDKEGPLDLGDIVEQAKKTMGISETAGGKVFSADLLRIELSGPEQPHLTLVDLPGLFQAGSTSQSDEDSETVRSMVRKYMEKPRSIILAVVSAKNDFNNQIVTRYAREIDPQGLRTMGLITKPDTLDEGSESERFYVDLAQNNDVKFRLGWHVLRNRDWQSRGATLMERNRKERSFFSTGIWTSLHPSQLGVESLKPRLSNVLKDQILAQLTGVLAQIEEGIDDCTSRLGRLGPSRSTLSEQRRHIFQASQAFTDLIKAAVDGSYSQPFFGKAISKEGRQKRLRAVVQNTLMDFEENMRKNGHTRAIIDDDMFINRACNTRRSEYITKVKELMQISRGRELTGTYDPMIIEELFSEQCQPWKEIVESYVGKIIDSSYFLVHAVLSYVCDQSTSEALLRHIIYPGMDGLKKNLYAKVAEILRPHYEGHPITYNHYLTDSVQKAQARRREREVKKSLGTFFGGDYTERGKISIKLDVGQLLNMITEKTESDMSSYASSTAADFMEAYYKVAIKKVIDDISVLALEACLIKQLSSLFGPANVMDIEDATITAIAAENEDSAAERDRCTEKLTILQEGIKDLKCLQKYQPIQAGAMDRPEISASHSDDENSSGDVEPIARQTRSTGSSQCTEESRTPTPAPEPEPQPTPATEDFTP